MLAHHDALRSGLGAVPIDRNALRAQLMQVAPLVLPYAAPVWRVLDEKRRQGKRILFEGAQGALLDIDFGTYPYVTSSNTLAGMAATGTGMGPGAVDFVLGIVKAYTTRVGSGPFPAELDDAVGERLGERGREFGTVTGRKRRCGWFDAVLVRQTSTTSGMHGVALTKLDVLDGFEELKICVGYELDGDADRLSADGGGAAGAGGAGLRDDGGLVANHRGGAVVGRAAGAGDQVCPADRGADRLPGGDAVDQPGARRHHPRHRPVHGMKLGWRARRRWSLVVLLVGLPLYVVAAVSVMNAIGRPSILVELLVYIGLGVLWAVPLRFVFRGIGREEERDP